jgi:acyl-CoA synthetase (AMP-forming)/AMP-acid ligase II
METTRVIIRSPYDDVELAQVPLHTFVLDGAAVRAAQPALIDGATGLVLSYRELAESVRKAASGLVAHGVAKGDVLALCSPNCPEFVVGYLAALAAGALVTTVNPLAPHGDVIRQLAHSRARWLVTTPALVKDSIAATAGVREKFVFGTAAGATPFAALADSGQPGQLPEVGPEGNAVLLYSSGTTGLP